MSKDTRRPPKIQQTAIQPVEIDEKTIRELVDLEDRDFSDFLRVLQYLKMLIAGTKPEEAAASINLNQRVLYNERWRNLMMKAKDLLARRFWPEASNAAAQVYAAWPEVVESVIRVAKHGEYERERVSAAELLYEMYIRPAQQQGNSLDPDQEKYLAAPKNFSPMAILKTIQTTTTVVTQQVVASGTDQTTGQTIDVQPDKRSDEH